MEAKLKIDLSPYLKAAASALTFLGLTASCVGRPSTAVDTLITGGMVYAGDDSPPITADVGIAGDRIVFVGDAARRGIRATNVVDAAGQVVAPGFVDPHTHVDEHLFSSEAARRVNSPFLAQGVTTAVIGNDGLGTYEVADALRRLETAGVGTNVATFVGFAPVRTKLLGEADRAPTPDELSAMAGLVARAMCEGAIGFSTGLFYAPQSYARTEEVARLAREAGKRGGVYDTHLRDESSYTIGLQAAIREALDIGRQGDVPVHIAHVKALGADVWGQSGAVIELVETAQAKGQRITADQYPWSASGTNLAPSLLPRWAEAGGRAEMLKRLDDPAQAARIRAAMKENMRLRGGAETLLIVSGPAALVGRTLAQVADEWAVDPIEAALRILRDGDPDIASFSQKEEDIRNFMKRPWVMTSSDATAGHPRWYGSFARKYANYVKNDQVITLGEFIRRSSSLPAQTFRLEGRGLLKTGYFADIVVFDPNSYAERSTYRMPRELAQGAMAVFVNGKLAWKNGQPTGALAGRGLRHKASAGTCPAN